MNTYRCALIIFMCLNFSLNFYSSAQLQDFRQKITIVVHGGAGTIEKKNMDQGTEKAYRDKIIEALTVGYTILESGGTSIDAVAEAIKIMENSPLFNAGKGAVFTSEGKNELDASLMDGKTKLAGAVACVTKIKNPILAAKAVMVNSPHVMLSGRGAEKFAKAMGLEIVKSKYFYTERRYKSLKQMKKREKLEGGLYDIFSGKEKFGTVGAIALDQFGNLSAGTSTGGMTNKKFGRVGDSPIIGAGTFADNQTCAVSTTGHGEFFMRYVVAYDVSARMKYLNQTLNESAESVIMNTLKEVGGRGGLIALDRNGNIAMPFNTEGMYRGYRKYGKPIKVMIFSD